MKNEADPLNKKKKKKCLMEAHFDIPQLTSLRREFENNDGRRVDGVPQETLL